MSTKPYKPLSLIWPLTDRQVQALDDALRDIYQRLRESLANTGVSVGDYGDATHVPSLSVDATGRVTSISEIAIALAASAISSGTLAAARLPAFSGDITTPVGSAVATLANSGVTAGTYGDATHGAVVTVDVKGRVTAASTVAISGGGSPLTNGNGSAPELIFDSFGDVIMVG